MSPDQIVHNRVALMLGDALVRKIALEVQAEESNKQIAELSARVAGLTQQVAELKPSDEANRPHPEDQDLKPGQ